MAFDDAFDNVFGDAEAVAQNLNDCATKLVPAELHYLPRYKSRTVKLPALR
jgi:hypothetical protein